MPGRRRKGAQSGMRVLYVWKRPKPARPIRMASIQLASIAEKRKGRSISPGLGAWAVWVGRLNSGWILCLISGWAGIWFIAGTHFFFQDDRKSRYHPVYPCYYLAENAEQILV